MIFHENCLILMIYHALFFLKIGKDVTNLSSAVVVIGTLRVYIPFHSYGPDETINLPSQTFHAQAYTKGLTSVHILSFVTNNSLS